jgi:nucleotide-binding universal stress UspA family protein
MHFAMKTVLLPTDFSDNAWNAIFTAIKLFYTTRCRFLILNVYHPKLDSVIGDSGDRKMQDIYHDLHEESEAALKKVLEYLQKESINPRHEFEVLSHHGELITAIRNLIRKQPIDMVIMGTQGATGAKKVLMGSNTVRVIQHIENRPVLAVPPSYDLQRLSTIVFPTDYLQAVEEYEISALTELLKQWKATLHVVYASGEALLKERQQTNRNLLKQRLQDIRVQFHEIPLKNNLSHTLAEFSHDLKADLIALVHRKRHFLQYLIREPVVKRMAFETKVPLLILPQLN